MGICKFQKSNQFIKKDLIMDDNGFVENIRNSASNVKKINKIKNI